MKINIFKKIKWYFLSNSQRIKLLRKRGVKIGESCYIEKDVKFGSEPYLISLGNNVRLTSNVKFVTHDGGMWVARNLGLDKNADKFGTIIIGNNVHIGWDVTIMPNTKIGSNCIIGVGTIVTKDIPDNSVVAGVPARIICSIEEYCEKNKNKVDFTKNLTSRAKKEYLEKKYHL